MPEPESTTKKTEEENPTPRSKLETNYHQAENKLGQNPTPKQHRARDQQEEGLRRETKQGIKRKELSTQQAEENKSRQSNNNRHRNRRGIPHGQLKPGRQLYKWGFFTDPKPHKKPSRSSNIRYFTPPPRSRKETQKSPGTSNTHRGSLFEDPSALNQKIRTRPPPLPREAATAEQTTNQADETHQRHEEAARAAT